MESSSSLTPSSSPPPSQPPTAAAALPLSSRVATLSVELSSPQPDLDRLGSSPPSPGPLLVPLLETPPLPPGGRGRLRHPLQLIADEEASRTPGGRRGKNGESTPPFRLQDLIAGIQILRRQVSVECQHNPRRSTATEEESTEG
ncbi:hypothetical protein E2562_020908 [Oryza meyeriana var. granulata]|uniref:Uncharacterized protein n=1 Tax=Oryza meyeriana var. granulata TaxID=110450 RepID=A0A6G1DYP6_9ORYZ|nr:hypothetical protein E2562_020908 [Oryza meyeriana var. granulata]